MYYYGERYYDPRLSIFISVDPLAEKTMEPYSYTGNNPIMFTDPTGMSADGWGKKGNTWEYKEEITADNYKDLKYDEYMESGIVFSKTNGVADGEYSYSLNSDGTVNNSYGRSMNESFTTARGTTINVNVNRGDSSLFDQANWILGSTATGIENSSSRFYIGTARLETPLNFLGKNYYGNGKWYLKGSFVGNALGKFSFGLGVAVDAIKVSSGATTLSKAGLNTGMGALGFTGWGLPASLFYAGLEAFYPGGTLGAMKDNSNAQAIYRKDNNGAVIKPRL